MFLLRRGVVLLLHGGIFSVKLGVSGAIEKHQ